MVIKKIQRDFHFVRGHCAHLVSCCDSISVLNIFFLRVSTNNLSIYIFKILFLLRFSFPRPLALDLASLLIPWCPPCAATYSVASNLKSFDSGFAKALPGFQGSLTGSGPLSHPTGKMHASIELAFPVPASIYVMCAYSSVVTSVMHS